MLKKVISTKIVPIRTPFFIIIGKFIANKPLKDLKLREEIEKFSVEGIPFYLAPHNLGYLPAYSSTMRESLPAEYFNQPIKVTFEGDFLRCTKI